MIKTNKYQSLLAAYSVKARHLRYYLVRRLTGWRLRSQHSTDRIYLWPPFDELNDVEALSGLRLNLRHYLNKLDICVEYYLYSPKGLKCCVLQTPVAEPVWDETVNETAIRHNLRRARYCVLWQVKDKPYGFSLRPSRYVVMERQDYYGGLEWIRLVSDLYCSRNSLPERKVPFPSYPVNSCAVLGSGPSCDDFISESGRWDSWIAANDVVRNERIRSLGKPFAVCILDPYAFAPVDCMGSLRSSVFAFLRETPAVFITTRDYAAFIELNFPDDIKTKCHYIKVLGHDTAQSFTRFELENMMVTGYGNVLTDIMLPVATAISRSIILYGCDGRPPTDHKMFPKSKLFQDSYKTLVNESGVDNNQSFCDDYMARNDLYTRHVVDECRRQGAQIMLRRPSWNAGLSGLPVLD